MKLSDPAMISLRIHEQKMSYKDAEIRDKQMKISNLVTEVSKLGRKVVELEQENEVLKKELTYKRYD